MKITITAISERQCARIYIYKKLKRLYIFIYIKPDTLQKAGQFALRFYIQKSRHFMLRDFHESFEAVIFIQKS